MKTYRIVINDMWHKEYVKTRKMSKLFLYKEDALNIFNSYKTLLTNNLTAFKNIIIKEDAILWEENKLKHQLVIEELEIDIPIKENDLNSYLHSNEKIQTKEVIV